MARLFCRLTTGDVAKVREALMSMLGTDTVQQKSRSTVGHMASHLRGFLISLLKQDGYKRLPQDLPDYLALPKAVYAKARPTQRRDFADLDEAQSLLETMPWGSSLLPTTPS